METVAKYHISLLLLAQLLLSASPASNYILRSCRVECYNSDQRVTFENMEKTNCEILPEKDVKVDNQIELTPTVYKLVENVELCNETRWLPGLNITWEVQDEDYRYKIEWRKLQHWHDSMVSSFRRNTQEANTCININLRPKCTSIPYKKCTLSCPQVVHNNIFIRLKVDSCQKKRLRISESMINFKEVNNKTYAGLSLSYRHDYGQQGSAAGTLTNPRYWSPIVIVHNDSQNSAIHTKFDLAPVVDMANNYHLVEYYKISLIDANTSRYLEKDNYTASNTEVYHGTYSFRNLTPGNYYIQILPKSKGIERGCATLEGKRVVLRERDSCRKNDGKDSCLKIDTGIFSIHEVFVAEESHLPLTIGLSVVVSLVLFLTILGAVVLRHYLCKNKKAYHLEDETIFMVYLGDKHHFRVVTQLKTLLECHGFSCILMDEYCPEMSSTTVPSVWLNNKIQTASKVLYLASEGSQWAVKNVESLGRGGLEDPYILSQYLFKTSLRILEELSPPKQSITVSYSQEVNKKHHQCSVPSFLSNLGNFQLMKDFDLFLQALLAGNEISSSHLTSNLPCTEQSKLLNSHICKKLKSSKEFRTFRETLEEVGEGMGGDVTSVMDVRVPSVGDMIVLFPPGSTGSLNESSDTQREIYISEDSGIRCHSEPLTLLHRLSA